MREPPKHKFTYQIVQGELSSEGWIQLVAGYGRETIYDFVLTAGSLHARVRLDVGELETLRAAIDETLDEAR